MKDYSKYFEYPDAFITEIGIDYAFDEDDKFDVENSSLIVKFADNMVNTYQLNSDHIAKYYGKLEQQYKEVIANKEAIILGKANKGKKRLHNISTVLFFGGVVSIISTFCFKIPTFVYGELLPNLQFYLQLASAFAISFGGVTRGIIDISRNTEKKDLATYEAILDKVSFLEEASYEDQNVCRNVFENDTARDALYKENFLCREGLSQTAFNINWIDHTDVDDLREISARLKKYQALKSAPRISDEYRTSVSEVSETNETFEDENNASLKRKIRKN